MISLKFDHAVIEKPSNRVKPIEISGAFVPQNFRIQYFLFDPGGSKRRWSVELALVIEKDGTPQAVEVLVKGVWLGATGFELEHHEGIEPKQMEAIKNELHRLKSLAVKIVVQMYGYGEGDEYDRWLPLHESAVPKAKDLKRIEREVDNLTARRKLNPTFLRQVAQIYKAEEASARFDNRRGRMILEIKDKLQANSTKTVDLWVKACRDAGYLPKSQRAKKGAK